MSLNNLFNYQINISNRRDIRFFQEKPHSLENDCQNWISLHPRSILKSLINVS